MDDPAAPPDPSSVPFLLVQSPEHLPALEHALDRATHVAIDTETPMTGPRRGRMRVMSVATRDANGAEQAFVIDARDLDPTLLAPALAGVTAAAWNANFDARVVDDAVFASEDTTPNLIWWDAQIADALIHQGRSGVSWYHGLAWATDHYLGLKAEGKGTTQLSYTATDDLTDAQISYAAADAVETLWVADAIRREIHDADLNEICEIEMAARPFLDRMERFGLPFDWPAWEVELQTMETQQRQVLGHIANLTGGGQGTLFDAVVEPTWNPASDRQVRAALNRWSSDEVMAWTGQHRGGARNLEDSDSVTASILREIGGELCDTLLEFRNLSKILTTYGESIKSHLDDDGRIRPQYLQVVGTNTGRLASRNPNAQNLTPRMKPHFRSGEPDRVFVHADLSQAELRFLAQVSEDGPLREAFARGDDVHLTTAATMFRFDVDQLQRTDPDLVKQRRQIAKALNFGIAYGQGAAALAVSLTRNGTPTSAEEGRQLLEQYRQTYPGTTAWAEARNQEIKDLGGRVGEIDWALTMRLAREFPDVAAARRAFREANSRWPSAEEIVALLPPDTDGARSETRTERVQWVLQYPAPVALAFTGEPFTFVSRTVAGRRQQFNLHLDRLFLTAAVNAVQSTSEPALRIRRTFEQAHGVVLHRPGRRLHETEIASQFEDRPLRRKYIQAIAAEQGNDGARTYLARAAKERISAMVNAWRNAPIQGGVADIMLVAYADLDHRLRPIRDAWPVQTVHDSVVIECNAADAEQVANHVQAALEAASRRYCPDVAPKADVDIRRSLADADIIHRSLR